jgi:uncharacterized membrane protein YbhN (UPF0104 family)
MPWVWRWVRGCVSLAVLAALLSFIPVRQLERALAQVPAGVLLSTIVVLIGGHVAAAMKWRLLQGGNTGLSVPSALRAHFQGVLANLWLPSVVGGDIVRASVTARHASRPALVVLASLIDRFVDSVGLLVIAFAGMVLVGGQSRDAWKLVIVVGSAVAVTGIACFGGYKYMKARPANLRFAPLVEAIDLMVRRPGTVVMALIISMVIQAAFILINVRIGHAVGMAAPLGAWFVAWPLAKLAALIPISAAGLGVREAALIVLMRPFGDPAETIMAAALVWQGAFIVGGALGGALFFFVPGSARLVQKPLQALGAGDGP